jgi:uncharacterized membrane-anchored protein YitT (DUF2179 family)
LLLLFFCIFALFARLEEGAFCMKQHAYWEIVQDWAADIVGGILIAVGVYNFAAASQFPMVGVNGIALILYQLFGLPIGTMSLLLNVPIVIFTFRILGRKFFLHSLRSMVISSLFLDFVAPLFPVYTGDRLLSAICCGILSGLGYGLIYMRGSSTGGVDFITLAIRAKKPHLSIGTISFVVDFAIVILGTLLVTKDVDSLIYGGILSYLISTVVDKVMYGIDQGKVALVVTTRGKEVCERINNTILRGATILKGIGSYSMEERDVVMCACNSKQMYGIRRLLKETDPGAFLVILESSDVIGEGFKTE